MEKSLKVFKPSKIRNIILPVISLGFILTGISLFKINLWIAILNIIFFGLCFVVAVINFLPNASYLKISAEGIEIKSLFKRHFLPWKAVSNFRVRNLILNKTVVFDIRNELLILNKSIIKGKTGGLPETYGMSPRNLAALLNEYAEKYSSHY